MSDSNSPPLNPPSNSSPIKAFKVTHSVVQLQADLASKSPKNPSPHPQETNDQVLKTSSFVPLPQDPAQPRENQGMFQSPPFHGSVP